MRAPRQATVLFQPHQILLANGKAAEPARGVQDAASQFVQLSWLFLTRPELLRVGQSIEFPLARPVCLWLQFADDSDEIRRSSSQEIRQ